MPEVHGILDRLLLFLAYEGRPHVTAEALVAMTDVLRRRAAFLSFYLRGVLGRRGGDTGAVLPPQPAGPSAAGAPGRSDGSVRCRCGMPVPRPPPAARCCRYPDAAEACVDAVAAISPEARTLSSWGAPR